MEGKRASSSDTAPQIRCSPKWLPRLADLLINDAVTLIKEHGVSKFLNFKSDCTGSRVLCAQLTKNAIVHDNSIEIPMPDADSLWITEDIIQHVLDLPTGSIKILPTPEDTESATNQFYRMFLAIKYVVDKYKKGKGKEKEKDPEEQAAGEDQQHEDEDQQQEDEDQQQAEDEQAEVPPPVSFMRDFFTVGNIELLFKHSEEDDVARLVNPLMLARLYLGTVLEKMLLCGSCNYVSSTHLQAVHDLDKLANIDWKYLVFRCLKLTLLDRQTPLPDKGSRQTTLPDKGDKGSGYLLGCTAVFTTVFLDKLKKNRISYLKEEEPGRINLYTERETSRLLMPDENGPKKKRKPGKKAFSLEDFEFKKWDECCYKNFRLPDRVVVPDHAVVPQNNVVPGKSKNSDENDAENIYKKYVLDRTCEKVVVDIGVYCVSQGTFVDCLKKKGHMHSNILHLVCFLWSADWKDTVILTEASVKCLLKRGMDIMDKALKTEKLKDAVEIYAPLVSEQHWSLVVVSHTTKKKYILDSLPGLHDTAVDTLLDNLKSYLLSEHSIDISENETERPRVKTQGNKFDCGFHVLLYIRGFKNMDIYCIDNEKVLRLREELSKYILFHEWNKIDPTLLPRDEETDEEDNEGECRIIQRAELPPSHKPDSPLSHNLSQPDSPLSHNLIFNGPAVQPTEPSPADNLPPSPPESPVQPSSGSPVQPAPLPQTESPLTQNPSEPAEPSLADNLPLSPPESPVPEQEVQPAQASLADNLSPGGSQPAEPSVSDNPSPGESPLPQTESPLTQNPSVAEAPQFSRTPGYGKRRMCPSNVVTPAFKQNTSLPIDDCIEIYDLFRTKFNDHEVLKLGEISITGGQLFAFFEEGQNAKLMMNAFVQVLKLDDEKNDYHNIRAIIPTNDLNDKAIGEEIEKELQAKNWVQRFISCAVLEEGEWIVFFFDAAIKEQITICHPNDTQFRDPDLKKLAVKFGHHVQQAFINCSRPSPLSELKTIRPAGLSHHFSRKDSAIACMSYLELFNGKETPRKKDIKALKLVHFLLHSGNKAQLPTEVAAVVNKEKKRPRKVEKKSTEDEMRTKKKKKGNM